MKGKTKLQTTDLHCSSLDTLPLSTCTLTLCPFHKTCSNAGKILSARDKCCRHSSRFHRQANGPCQRLTKFAQPLSEFCSRTNKLAQRPTKCRLRSAKFYRRANKLCWPLTKFAWRLRKSCRGPSRFSRPAILLGRPPI